MSILVLSEEIDIHSTSKSVIMTTNGNTLNLND